LFPAVNDVVDPLPPPVEVMVDKTELEPLVIPVPELFPPEPPPPTVTVYEVPRLMVNAVSADAPPPLVPAEVLYPPAPPPPDLSLEEAPPPPAITRKSAVNALANVTVSLVVLVAVTE
jgi:hypothetical protein